MLFRRTKQTEGQESRQPKKSLLEKLVIIDADEMSPQEIRETLEDMPVEAKIVRLTPAEGDIDSFEANPGISEQPTYRMSVEDVTPPAAFGTDEIEETQEAEEEPEEAAAEPALDSFSVVDPTSEIESHFGGLAAGEKNFDVLDRAQAEPENSGEEIRIIYRIPKRATGENVSRSSIHNELIERINNSLQEETAEAEPEPEIEDEPEVEPTVEEPIPSPFMEPLPEPALEENISYPHFEEPQYHASDSEVIEQIAEAIREESAAPLAASEPARAPEQSPNIEWIARVEDVPDMPRVRHFDKILFPEQYFYASNGAVYRSAHDLHNALGSMDDWTFANHATSRNTNDFANWIQGVYGHEDCARRLNAAGGKEDMQTVLEVYLQ